MYKFIHYRKTLKKVYFILEIKILDPSNPFTYANKNNLFFISILIILYFFSLKHSHIF